jgi:N-acetylneuraminic acid mutarotase
MAITWSSKVSLATPRAGLAAAAAGTKIYALGGFNGGELNTTAVYDTGTGTWSSKAPMLSKRGGLAAAISHGKVYAIGGCALGASDPVNCDFNGISLNSIEAYAPATNVWKSKAPMPTARADLAAVTGLDGKIYVMGGWNVRNGFNDPVALDTVEAYDPVTNTWATKAPMPTARYWVSAARGSDGRIYAYGGVDTTTNALSTFEAYDPSTNTWATLPGLFLSGSATAAVGAAFLGGKVYVIGGSDADYVPHRNVESYSLATGTWKIQVSMPTARGYLAAVATGGHLYAIGGYNNNSPYTGDLAQVESSP